MWRSRKGVKNILFHRDFRPGGNDFELCEEANGETYDTSLLLSFGSGGGDRERDSRIAEVCDGVGLSPKWKIER